MDARQKAISGITWVAFEKLISQIAQFIFAVILARILDPSDYGIVGMLGIFLAIASTFQDSGMGSALIQKQDRTERDYSTVFYYNLFVAIVCYLLLFVFAPTIASFYHTPILKDVTRVVSLHLIISAFGAINWTRLSIEMRFKEQSVISVASMFVASLLGIILAVQGFGVWALVFQSIFGAILTCILTIYVTKWLPKSGFSISSFKRLFGYGSRLLGSSLINTIYNNIYTLIIGRVFSPSQVGYYTRANGYAILPGGIIQGMALKVNFPILSTMQDDNERLLRAYRKLLSLPMYLLYPILIGMAVVAEPLIQVMIGDVWLPCVPMLQILCVGYMFGPLTHFNLNLLYVKGRTDLVLKLELIKKPIAFAILIITIPLGILWMVIGQALYCFIAFTINCYYTKKILDYGFVSQIRVLTPIFLNSIIMGGLTMLTMQLVDSSWEKLIVGFFTGFLSYLIVSIITRDENFMEIKEIIKSRMLRKKKS